DDDERHPDRGDGEERVVDEEVEEHLEREEPVEQVRAGAVHDQEQRDGDAQGQELVVPALREEARRGHRSALALSTALTRSDCRMLTANTTRPFTTSVTSGATPTA